MEQLPNQPEEQKNEITFDEVVEIVSVYREMMEKGDTEALKPQQEKIANLNISTDTLLKAYLRVF